MNNNCITYHIDKDNKIVFLSEEWQLFADKNKACHLTVDTVLNHDIFDYVADVSCQHIYQIIINRSRKEQKTLQFQFRCDAPDNRRFMSMEITPLEKGALGFESCIKREEPREPILLLDSATERSDEFLKICSFCKKIEVDGSWMEVEAAIENLKLFNINMLPHLSHGVCPSCYEDAMK